MTFQEIYVKFGTLEFPKTIKYNVLLHRYQCHTLFLNCYVLTETKAVY